VTARRHEPWPAGSKEILEIEQWSLFGLRNVDAFALKFLKDYFNDPRVAGDSARTTAARLVNGGQNGCVKTQIHSMPIRVFCGWAPATHTKG
jgi:hypothetical protein